VAHRSAKPGRDLERAALSYATNGFEVFPLKPREKRPLHSGWQAQATRDVASVAAAWRRDPDANIGVACRELIVLDTDDERGLAAVRDLDLPETTAARTGRGMHFYLEGSGSSRSGVLPGLDVRAGRAYVVGAGSVHPSGAVYEWQVPPWEVPPAPAPRAVRELLRRRAGRVKQSSQPIGQGRRNVTLTRLAGGLRALGLSGEEVRGVLHEHNSRRCLPPLPGQEVDRIAKSAAGWPEPPPWVSNPFGFVDDPALDSSGRLVLAALCSHAKDNGWCKPSVRRLAELTKLRTDTVTSAVRRLEEHGRLSVSRSRRSGNHYRILNRPPVGPPSGGSVRRFGTEADA